MMALTECDLKYRKLGYANETRHRLTKTCEHEFKMRNKHIEDVTWPERHKDCRDYCTEVHKTEYGGCIQFDPDRPSFCLCGYAPFIKNNSIDWIHKAQETYRINFKGKHEFGTLSRPNE